VSGRFDGLVAIVTGAGGGLGQASAELLAAEGAHVIGVDIDGEAVTAVVRRLPTESLAVCADVAEEAGVQAYVDAGLARFGRIDLHHLNAGIFGTLSPLPDTSAAEFDRVQAVNVRGQFLGLRAAFRCYRDQLSTGAVVLTASIASLTGSADLLSYVTSKHATVGLVRSGAMYGGPLGIRVNGVAPGIVPTDLFAAAADAVGGKNDMERRASTAPLRRAGTPQEIAAVTAFLLSADSAYVTGQIISADGGATVMNTVRPSGGAGAWDAAGHDHQLYGPSWARKDTTS
jgi:NAD(P)-dependent dehydrogenase (short-subunit alcohol dehydrogenase family)